MPRKPIQIGRNKLRAAVRKLRNEYVFYMLDDAIELLSPAKLHQLAKNYLDLKRLQPEAEPATEPSLLTDVKRKCLRAPRRAATPDQCRALEGIRGA